jgi:hypothetical protein
MCRKIRCDTLGWNFLGTEHPLKGDVGPVRLTARRVPPSSQRSPSRSARGPNPTQPKSPATFAKEKNKKSPATKPRFQRGSATVHLTVSLAFLSVRVRWLTGQPPPPSVRSSPAPFFPWAATTGRAPPHFAIYSPTTITHQVCPLLLSPFLPMRSEHHKP